MLIWSWQRNIKTHTTHIDRGTRTRGKHESWCVCVCVYKSRQIEEKNNNKHTKSNIIKTEPIDERYGTVCWRVLVCRNRGCDWINCLDYGIRNRKRSCVFASGILIHTHVRTNVATTAVATVVDRWSSSTRRQKQQQPRWC